MEKGNEKNVGTSKFGLILTILAIGSLCGLTEVLLSGWIRSAGIPFRAGILTGVGFGLIAVGLAIFRKPGIALAIGAVAILGKQLVVPLVGMSMMCKMNSCIAVGLSYGALAAIGAFTMSKMRRNTGARILTAVGAAGIGSLVFYGVGMRVAPCAYLLSYNSLAGFGSFLLHETLSLMVFSAILFPAGWALGNAIAANSVRLMNERPVLYNTSAALTTVLALILTSVAITMGF